MVESEQSIETSYNPMGQGSDYMLGVEAVQSHQFSRDYSGSFERYAVLRCLVAEALSFCEPMLGIFPTYRIRTIHQLQLFGIDL